HVFKRNGYEWDVGIHYIGGVNHHKTLMYALFHYISGGQMQWEDMGEVYDKVRFGDELFEFRKGPKNFLKQLQEYFPDPADQRAIEQYLELVQEANAASTNYFAEKALPPLVAKVAGGQMRKGFLRFAEQTTLEVLEELTTNRKLIAVLTAQFGDYGLPPGQSSFAMHAMVVNHYLHGAAFPAGGSSTIAETISEVIAAAGGLILTNAEVSELIVENKRAAGVKMADGQTLRAPLIISGVGVRNSYLHLMPEPWRTEYDLAHQAQQVQPSAAHMCLYLGFKETAAELGLQKANYWIYPDGQYDHDLNVERFVEDATAEFPVVYISFPSAKDPHWEERYPGRATVDIITLAPYDWFEKWEGTSWKRRGADYEAFKEGLKERLLEVLYRYEPQLRGKVDHAELSTPLSTKDFVNYQHGEIYGINHDPGRFGQTFLRPQTPLKNFYLTGQDIVTAGIGGALMSGV
ncbi:MAG: NAD(P)/FAD-dependent oxidoreductase, partial [Anaerolineales bacterium]|nr:NAD(P)/FAD-dependent oxidoreductase [Anaerolineales bacterium]